MTFDYDFFVIGAGSGGLAAANQAAAHGAKVAIAEKHRIGGVCVNRGCVPKKLMVYASRMAKSPGDMADYGWDLHFTQPPSFDWKRFIAHQNQEIQRLNQVHEQHLRDAGVTVLRGHVTFVDPHTLQVEGEAETQTVTAKKILIAVGGHPIKPPISGIEKAITSREMFHLPEQPQRFAVVGGGYVGVEFACIMNGFGSEVTLIEQKSRILMRFDAEVATTLQAGLSANGIQIELGSQVNEISADSDGLRLQLTGNSSRSLSVDAVLVAVGRSPNTDQLKLENAGVECSQGDAGPKGIIPVDDFHCTTQPHIFAVGDCIGRVNLTPVAIAAGKSVAHREFGDEFNQQTQTVDYDFVPTATFAQPEAAMIGLTEAKARERYGEKAVQCYRSKFQPLFYNLTQRDETTLLKLLVEKSSQRVLGAHMVGEGAAEMMQHLAIAIKLGLTKPQLDQSIGIHPTAGEEWTSL